MLKFLSNLRQLMLTFLVAVQDQYYHIPEARRPFQHKVKIECNNPMALLLPKVIFKFYRFFVNVLFVPVLSKMWNHTIVCTDTLFRNIILKKAQT